MSYNLPTLQELKDVFVEDIERALSASDGKEQKLYKGFDSTDSDMRDLLHFLFSYEFSNGTASVMEVIDNTRNVYGNVTLEPGQKFYTFRCFLNRIEE